MATAAGVGVANPLKSFECRVMFTETLLLVTGKDRRGERTIRVDLTRARDVWTDEERDTVDWLTGDRQRGVPFTQSLTRAELHRLAVLRNKTGCDVKPSPVAEQLAALPPKTMVITEEEKPIPKDVRKTLDALVNAAVESDHVVPPAQKPVTLGGSPQGKGAASAVDFASATVLQPDFHAKNNPAPTPAQSGASDTIDKDLAKLHGRTNRYVSNGSQDEAKRAEVEIGKRQRTTEVLAQAGRFCLLDYDIPDVLNTDCPNPSGLLWCFGFRHSDSVWVLPERCFDSGPVRELLDHWRNFPAVEFNISPFDPECMQQMRDRAVRKLREEITRVHTALITRLDKANKKYHRVVEEMNKLAAEAEAAGLTNGDKAQSRIDSRHDNDVRRAIRESAEALDYCVKCAEQFDETERVADLLEGLRSAVESERKSFDARMQLKGRRGVFADGTPDESDEDK